MFRFTIRELVLLTLVVAMGVGWWIDRNRLQARWSNRIDVLRVEIRDRGWELFDWGDGNYHIEYPPHPSRP